jgi:L-threonylcarbamoyladenylate synthase
MRALLEACGRPLAAPSANASGQISPVRAEHVATSLGARVPLIVDGGKCERGLESTIVAATGGPLRLLRRGPIDVPGAVEAAGRIEAPGMTASHYAPSKPLRLDALSAKAGELLIGYGDVRGSLYLGATPIEAAANLFDMMHRADATNATRIAVAPIAGEGLAAAIRDRLKRAAAPRP